MFYSFLLLLNILAAVQAFPFLPTALSTTTECTNDSCLQNRNIETEIAPVENVLPKTPQKLGRFVVAPWSTKSVHERQLSNSTFVYRKKDVAVGATPVQQRQTGNGTILTSLESNSTILDASPYRKLRARAVENAKKRAARFQKRSFAGLLARQNNSTRSGRPARNSTSSTSATAKKNSTLASTIQSSNFSLAARSPIPRGRFWTRRQINSTTLLSWNSTSTSDGA